MSVLHCSQCQHACVEEGGLCAPGDAHSVEVAQEAGIDFHDEQRLHKVRAHKMTIEGAVWRCERGHTREASGQEAMLAAGMEPML